MREILGEASVIFFFFLSFQITHTQAEVNPPEKTYEPTYRPTQVKIPQIAQMYLVEPTTPVQRGTTTMQEDQLQVISGTLT